MLKVQEHKQPQHGLATIRFSEVKRLVLPLSQHTGKPSIPVVEPKQRVEAGALIARNDGMISATLSSPVTGIIQSLDSCSHPLLKKTACIRIKCEQQEFSSSPRKNVDKMDKKALLTAIARAGIVGMGGACFPTHVKLTPPKKIDILLINGCECEPYLACDNRLMVENLDQIFQGIDVIAKILVPRTIIFAVEENKREAIILLKKYLHGRKSDRGKVKLRVLKSRYPQGGEKQLIFNTTRRIVPQGGLPFDVGCLVHNVATCFAIFEAVYFGKPLIERLVTFAGSALKEPKNIWVRIGTLISELVERNVLEFVTEPSLVVSGGPMMGVALEHLDYPVVKGMSGVLFLTKEEVDRRNETACLRCARCVDTCPMNLLPLEYAKIVKHKKYELLSHHAIRDCIECGCCAYVCPAKIPLVHYIKVGKQRLQK